MNDSSSSTVHEGLADILVARTRLSDVNGALGKLVVAGYPIEDLAGSVSFEAVCGLLLDGRLAAAERTDEIRRLLGLARAGAHRRLALFLPALLDTADAMSALRAALATLEPDATAFDALGMASVATAAWVRQRRPGAVLAAAAIAPDPGLPHAHDLLRLMRGQAPSAREAALLDAYLVTVADHGFNASTFAARVAASTGADLASSIVAGVCTLSGPLHGGAPGPVLDMLDAIATPANAAAFIERELDAGRRIMGMGHRVYRVRDPRAFVLERAVRRFQDSGATADRLLLARAVERAAEDALSRRHPERALRANVEFYTAVLLEALDVPRAAFTAIFACSRCLGYAAHYQEQRASGRLIRPSALYVGPAVDEAAHTAKTGKTGKTG